MALQCMKHPHHRGAWYVAGLKTAGLLGLLVLTVFAVRGAWGMYQKLDAASSAEQKAQTELAALKQKKEKVSTALVALSSPRGEEAEVRQRFGVVRPGEGVIHIVPSEATSSLQIAPQESWLQHMVRALFPW